MSLTADPPWWSAALRHNWLTLHAIWVNFGAICAFIVCTWALFRGGRIERYAAATIAVGWILTAFLQSHGGQRSEVPVMLIDLVACVVFVMLSLHARKSWTVYLAACQLCGVLVRLVARTIHFGMASYITIIGIFSGWGLLVALAVGMWQCEVRRGRKT